MSLTMKVVMMAPPALEDAELDARADIPTSSPPRWVTRNEAALLFGISAAAIDARVAEGAVRSVSLRSGGRTSPGILINLDDLTSKPGIHSGSHRPAETERTPGGGCDHPGKTG
jgi:hypothetical protein